MKQGDSWPIAISSVPSAGADPAPAGAENAVGSMIVRSADTLRAVAIVKATFAMTPDQPMSLTDPEPLVKGDEHRDKSANAALVTPSDLVPYRPRADVILKGHARAFQGRAESVITVRLLVARDQTVLLNKRLQAQGNPDPAKPGSGPSPFTVMPLAYELACAGPDNPVGVVQQGQQQGQWANLIDPRRRGQPAGFGPISARWPQRRRLLTIDPAILTAPIPNIPPDFPWAYFNVAPEDQRIEFLHGDEWVGTEGTSAALPRVQSRLPGARAVAALYGPAAELSRGKPFAMVADTLIVDADKQRCSVVWRGALPVPKDSDLTRLGIFAGVETAGRKVELPSQLIERRAPSGSFSVAQPPSIKDADQNKTAALTLDAFAATAAPATPFKPSPSPAPATPFERVKQPPASPPATPFERVKQPPATPFERVKQPPATPFERPSKSSPPVQSPVEQAIPAPFGRISDPGMTMLPGLDSAAPAKPATPFERPSKSSPPAQSPFAQAIPAPFGRISDPAMTMVPGLDSPAPARPATPFERPSKSSPPAQSPFAQGAPGASPPVRRISDMAMTAVPGLDSAAPPKPATPFERPPSTAPVEPVLARAATPFERPPSTAPVEPVLPRAATPFEHVEGEGRTSDASEGFYAVAKPEALAALPVVVEAPIAKPNLAPAIEDQPKTLGDHFLAAMRRASKTGSPQAGLRVE